MRRLLRSRNIQKDVVVVFTSLGTIGATFNARCMTSACFKSPGVVEGHRCVSALIRRNSVTNNAVRLTPTHVGPFEKKFELTLLLH